MLNPNRFPLWCFLAGVVLDGIYWGTLSSYVPPWIFVASMFILFYYSQNFGLSMALVFGFTSDLIHYQTIGIDGLIYILLCYFMRLSIPWISSQNTILTACFLGVYVIFYLILSFIAQVSLGSILWQQLQIVPIITVSCLSILLFLIMSKLHQRLHQRLYQRMQH